MKNRWTREAVLLAIGAELERIWTHVLEDPPPEQLQRLLDKLEAIARGRRTPLPSYERRLHPWPQEYAARLASRSDERLVYPLPGAGVLERASDCAYPAYDQRSRYGPSA